VIPVVDGHNDVLLRLWLSGRPESFFERSDEGHVDLPRAREGGLAAGFFAVFVREEDAEVDVEARRYELGLSPPVEHAYAARVAAEQIELLHRLAAGGELAVARTVADVERAVAGGPLAAILHLEGAEPIDPKLRALDPLVESGLRSLGIVWSRPNAFGVGVPFAFPGHPDVGPGLTPAGRTLVTRCNEIGVMVDVSHLNGAGFDDVARLSSTPLVATHSNAHALCPIPRNLTDRQLDAIRDSGGVVGVVPDVMMSRPDAANELETPIDVIVAHIEHLAERMGVEHVAIGSDFDGCTPPAVLRDVSRLQLLLDALAWSDAELRKLAHENWLRVLRATWC